MQAIVVNRFGDPDVMKLVDRPTPSPGAGELRVNVQAIGVGWLDTQIRRGRAPKVFSVEPPFVPGGAVAGTVDAVGAGVDGRWVGARVLARAAGGMYGGGYANTVIARLEGTFTVPAELDLRHALAVLDDGSTALALLEKTPVHEGEWILIAPGLGGLGHLLVQLARAAGASVIAAVRGSEKVAIAQTLGAEVVDYATPEWPERVLRVTGGRRLDVVFDGIGGAVGAALSSLLADGGRFSGYGMTSGSETTMAEEDRKRLTVVNMSQLPEFWRDTPRRIEQVLQLVASGRLIPIIGRTYPLAEAAAAHTDVEGRRSIGKILLLP